MPATDTTTTATDIIARLKQAWEMAVEMDSIASVEIWIPDEQETADMAADGITAQPTLEVTVWRCEPNPHDVIHAIEWLGLECIGTGSADRGPCYSFVVRTA